MDVGLPPASPSEKDVDVQVKHYHGVEVYRYRSIRSI